MIFGDVSNNPGVPDGAPEKVIVTPGESLKKILEANVSYQASLVTCLQLTEQQIACKEKKEHLLKDALTRSNVFPISCVFRTPYIQDSKGHPAPAMTAEVQLDVLPDLEDPVAARVMWKPSDDELLSSAVTKTLIGKRLADLNNDRFKLEKKLKDLKVELGQPEAVPNSMTLRQQIVETEAQLQETLATKMALEAPNFNRSLLSGVELKDYDWYEFVHDPVLKRHGDTACRLRFENLVNPAIRHGEWTQSEKDQLLELVEIHGKNNWNVISAAISSRKPFTCCAQYRKMQVESNQSRKQASIVGAFTAKEVASLIHGFVVCEGLWPSICRMIPGRTAEQCRKYWENHLDVSANLESWTKKELKVMKEFASKSKTSKLTKLYSKIPRRLRVHVARKFRILYKFSEESSTWIPLIGMKKERQPIHHEKNTAFILQKLHQHVFRTVTRPLRDDGSLKLEDVLERKEVVNSVGAFLRDLGLLVVKEIYDVDAVAAVQYSLSPIDKKLIRLFASDNLVRPKATGRPRKENPFGNVPPESQMQSEDRLLDVVKSALSSERGSVKKSAAVLIPPSVFTFDALLKLKSIVSELGETAAANLWTMVNEEDILPIIHRMISMFAAIETLLYTQKPAEVTTAPVEAVEPATGGGTPTPPSTQPKVRKKKSRAGNKTLLRRRIKWIKEDHDRKAGELREKRAKQAVTVKERSAKGILKRTGESLEPVRKSARIGK